MEFDLSTATIEKKEDKQEFDLSSAIAVEKPQPKTDIPTIHNRKAINSYKPLSDFEYSEEQDNTNKQWVHDYASKEKLAEWNTKNYVPLKDGYLQSQITWFEKRRPLPPNYDKPIYKEFGITSPPEPGIKNPINYTIKKALQSKGKKSRQKKKS